MQNIGGGGEVEYMQSGVQVPLLAGTGSSRAGVAVCLNHDLPAMVVRKCWLAKHRRQQIAIEIVCGSTP